jgi:phytoene desaturase
VDIRKDLKYNRKIFKELEKNGDKKFNEYLDKSKYQYRVAMQEFVYREYTSLLDFVNRRFLTEGFKLHLFDNFDKYVGRFFTSEEAKKILEYTIVFLGGDPKNTPAFYSLMSHVDFNLGVWYPQGGLNAVAVGISQLAKELGVRFIYNCEARRLDINNHRVSQIVTSKGTLPADVVVVNTDYHFAETKLLPKKSRSYPDKYWQHRTIAPSAFIVYLGLKKRLPRLRHHNLFLDQDWQRHFRDIFQKPGWPKNPSYYVNCPTKTDPTMAPKNKENLFILVPVAAGLRDNPVIRKRYLTQIINHLENLLKTEIAKHIEISRIFSINDFAYDYHAFKGTALGLAHTLWQTALFRPAHRSRKVDNLYYVGQYTHPGIGVPISIISSQIVCPQIIKQYG